MDVEYFEVSNAVYFSLKKIKTKELIHTLKNMQKKGLNIKKIGVSITIIEKITKEFDKKKKHNSQYGKVREDLSNISNKIELPVLLINHILKEKKLK